MRDDFAAFILTHGRPKRVFTYKYLLKGGYTGKIFIVVDNEDKELEEYRKKFGDKVVVFDKKEAAKTFDNGDNFQDRRAIVYARNACFGIAESLGIKNFIQLDDDYTSFVYKFNEHLEYGEKRILSLDKVLGLLLDFYLSTPALSVAMAQNGDFIGGNKSKFAREVKLRRKCMNTFFCSTDRPFQFVGRVNEDVNTYTCLAAKGGLFMTVPNVAIIQVQTQKGKGGMSEMYLDSGTYVKSFYSAIYSPSSVSIGEMGHKHRRIHHRVSWKNAAPMIISEEHRKA